MHMISYIYRISRYIPMRLNSVKLRRKILSLLIDCYISNTTIFDDNVVVIVNCDVPVKYEEKSKNLQKYYLGS